MAAKKQPCKVCGEKTAIGFNINFKRLPICEHCARVIFIQQAAWFMDNVPMPEPNKSSKNKKQ